MENATWTIAGFTGLYAFAVAVSVIYIAGQLRENRKQVRESKRLGEATVLKQAYDYVRDTHKFREIIFDYEKPIIRDIPKEVKDPRDLQRWKEWKGTHPTINEAIYEVANCYHYIGFLVKYDLLTNRQAIFEEGGDNFRRIYDIISPWLERERAIHGESYKQYLDYLVKESNKWLSQKA